VANRVDRGLPLRPVRDELLEEGVDAATAAVVIAEGIAAYRRAGWRNLLLGPLVIVLAVLIFVLARWIPLHVADIGLLLFGGWLFCRGVYQLYRAGTASLEPKQRTRYL
jgi:hypothetical protein